MGCGASTVAVNSANGAPAATGGGEATTASKNSPSPTAVAQVGGDVQVVALTTTTTTTTVTVVAARTFCELLTTIADPNPSKGKVVEVIEGACGPTSVATEAVKKLESVAPSNAAMIASAAFSWMGTVAPPPFNTVLGLMGKVFHAAGVAQHNQRMAKYLASRLLSINEPLSEVMARGDYKNPTTSEKKLAARIEDVLTECHEHLSEFLPPVTEDQNALVEWAKVKIKEITTTQDAWDELHVKIDQLLRDVTFHDVVRSRQEQADMRRMIEEDATDLKDMLTGLRVEIDKLTAETSKMANLTVQMLKGQEFEDMLVNAAQVRLVQPIGEGGQGVVWDARLNNKQKVVAKKVVATNSNQAENSLREAKMLMGFRHPNIVQCFGVTVKEGETYVLLERCVESLAGVAVGQEGTGAVARLPIGAVLNCAYDVACALSVVHGKRLVHRDIKTDNAMVKPDGDICLIDFGSMKRELPKAAVSMHTTMAMAGLEGTTAVYAAPELLINPAYVATPACDVYSFAMLLYELLHGARAFEKESKTFKSNLQLTAKIADGLRPEIDAALPQEVQDLLKDCWEEAPERRPQMESIKDRLDRMMSRHYPDAEESWRQLLTERWGSAPTGIDATARGGGAGNVLDASVTSPAGAAVAVTTPAAAQAVKSSLEACPLSACSRVSTLCLASGTTATSKPEDVCAILSKSLGLVIAPLRFKHYLNRRGKGVNHLEAALLPQTVCDFIFEFVKREFEDAAKDKPGLTTDEVRRVVNVLIPQTVDELKDDLDTLLDEARRSSRSNVISDEQFFDLLETFFEEALGKAEASAATADGAVVTTTTAAAAVTTPAAGTATPAASSVLKGSPTLLHDMLYEIVPCYNESLRLQITSLVPGSLRDGAAMSFGEADGSSAQRFVALDNTNGTWSFQVQCSSNLVVDNSGAPGARCHFWSNIPGNPNAAWVLASPSGTTGGPAGVFTLRCKASDGHVLSIVASDSGGFVPYTLPTKPNALEQQFKFVRVAVDRAIVSGNVYEIAPESNESLRVGMRDSDSIADGSKISLQPMNPRGSSRQQWKAQQNDDGTWLFALCENHRFVLDNGGGHSRACHLWTSVPNHENQGWCLQSVAAAAANPVSTGGGSYLVRSKLCRNAAWLHDTFGEGFLLNVPLSCGVADVDPSQRFKLIPVAVPAGSSLVSSIPESERLVSGAVYEIMPEHGPHLRVDVAGGETANGTAIRMWSRNIGFGAQTFTAVQNPNGSWSFTATCAGGKSAIDWTGNAHSPCHLWQYIPAHPNQSFTVDPVGGGFNTVRVFNRSDFVWDVEGSGGERARLLNWNYHGGPNQRFRFMRVAAASASPGAAAATQLPATKNSLNFAVKISPKNGKYYCGKTRGFDCGCCDRNCGPGSGCNCIPCQLLDQERARLPPRTAVVNREGVVSRPGTGPGAETLYCGRNNMKHDASTNGFCGPNSGNNCSACKIAQKTYGPLIQVLAPGKDYLRAWCYSSAERNGASNWCNARGDILFHFNPRVAENQVVMNTHVRGGWGNEERIALPSTFKGRVEVTVEGYRIKDSSGAVLHLFRHRVPFSEFSAVTGDANWTFVEAT